MMNEKSNISNVFREKLGQYAETPPAHVWDGVQGQLKAMKKKKQMIILRRIAAAAVVVMAFLAGWYLNNEPDNQYIESASVNSVNTPANNGLQNTEPNVGEKIIPQSVKDNTAGTNLKKENMPQVAASYVASAANSEKAPEVKPNVADLERIALKKLPYENAQLVVVQHELQPVHIKEPKKNYSLNETDKLLIAQNALKIKAQEHEHVVKVGVSVAPGFSSYTSDYSSGYIQNMTAGSTDLNSNVSGGLSFRYKTGKKIAIESGIHYAQNGRNTSSSSLLAFANEQDFAVVPEVADSRFFNASVQLKADNRLEMNSVAGVIQMDRLPQGSALAASPEYNSSADTRALLTNGDFSQVFDFIEVPVLLRYLVLDSKIDLELVGGVNAGLIVGNNAYIESSYGTQNIGKTKDISSFNISGALGLGMNYSLSRSISVNLEPRFNYYLNSINQGGQVDYRPYRLGFYTGLFYSF